MELSVIIPTTKPRSQVDALEYLHQCQFDDYEIILRDDYPVTKARNEGAKQARSDKLVYLDDDSMPRDGYLEAAAATLDDEPAVAGLTIHPRDDIFASDLTSHYDFGDRSKYVDHFWGCNMGIRRDVLTAVGGWDENMGWGHEERELADRVNENHAIYYNPEMIVEHAYVDSIPEYWSKRYKLEKQTPYYLHKNGYSQREILLKTVIGALKPTKYIRRSLLLTAVRSGARVAETGGRVAGMIDQQTADASPSDEQSAPAAGSGQVVEQPGTDQK